MITEKATIADTSNGVVVSHVYRLPDDALRYTSFYLCSNHMAAEHLVIALLRKTNETVPQK